MEMGENCCENKEGTVQLTLDLLAGFPDSKSDESKKLARFALFGVPYISLTHRSSPHSPFVESPKCLAELPPLQFGQSIVLCRRLLSSTTHLVLLLQNGTIVSSSVLKAEKKLLVLTNVLFYGKQSGNHRLDLRILFDDKSNYLKYKQ
eukprot:CCRYP_007195-RC/>CCRYP_007195-RC protein AED:0.40 eAED:0.67 QI:0/0/0/1/0/0/3/475/147